MATYYLHNNNKLYKVVNNKVFMYWDKWDNGWRFCCHVNTTSTTEAGIYSRIMDGVKEISEEDLLLYMI